MYIYIYIFIMGFWFSLILCIIFSDFMFYGRWEGQFRAKDSWVANSDFAH